MATIKARAIVLAETTRGEADKQLVLLAKDIGKITVYAKGAKNPKSKFAASGSAFCYGDFMLFQGANFLSVTQIDLIKNFGASFDTIDKLMYGAYFLEIADKAIMPEQQSNAEMLLLLKALTALQKGDGKRADNEKKISAAFSLKFLDLIGLRPDIADCQSALPAGTAMNEDVKKAITYILGTEDFDRTFMFTAQKLAIAQLNGIAELLVQKNLESVSKSLSIIKKSDDFLARL